MPKKPNSRNVSRGHRRASGPSERTQAEIDYGTGARVSPPQYEELSPQSQQAVEEAYAASMSNMASRERLFAERGSKGALSPGQLDRLTDQTVTIDDAGRNMASHWEHMMAQPERPDPAWYFGQNRRLGEVAEATGLDPSKVMSASAAMSPQNSPDMEYRAAAAMADAVGNNRHIHDVNYGRRKMTTLTPQEMQDITATSNAGNVSAAPDFDLAGFRSAGTNRQEGWRGISEEGYNPVEKMNAAKVHWYDSSIQNATPDSPLHAEYEARFGDQVEARNVRLGREADAASGTSQIRGVTDRVDIWGLMHGTDDPSDPAYNHPVLGETGTNVPDTWMAALQSGQPMLDEVGSSSPAKAAGSQTATTSASVKGTTFMGPKEAEAAGGKRLTGNTVWGIGASRANQQGARFAREPESQTNIPPVMMQEMTWVQGRRDVADSTERLLETGAVQPGTARTRIDRLRGGGLEGQKEFRPTAPTSSSIMPDGAFHRGAPDFTGDSVRVIPSQMDGPLRGAPNPETHELQAPAPSGAADMLARQKAIRSAHDTYRQSRADGSSAWWGEEQIQRGLVHEQDVSPARTSKKEDSNQGRPF